jgi:hypothetical protein
MAQEQTGRRAPRSPDGEYAGRSMSLFLIFLVVWTFGLCGNLQSWVPGYGSTPFGSPMDESSHRQMIARRKSLLRLRGWDWNTLVLGDKV